MSKLVIALCVYLASYVFTSHPMNVTLVHINCIDHSRHDTVRRTYLNDTTFSDITSFYAFGKFGGFYFDTFQITRNDWYIKKFGSFQLYFGERSGNMDSIDVKSDLKVKKSDYSSLYFDSTCSNPFSSRYYFVRKIVVDKNRSVYQYREKMFIDGVESADDDIFFDSMIGVVKTRSKWGVFCLDKYPYLDKLNY